MNEATNQYIKLMGIDLSLTSTGISIGGETFAITPKTKGIERLVEVSTRVVELATRYNPSAIILEGYSFGSKFTRAHAIGELGGCVKVAVYQAGFQIVEVPPTCRAKFATGKGNASKVDVLLAIKRLTGKDFPGASGDDECDAWVLEQMGLAVLGESPYNWSEAQLSALDKINWSPLYQSLGRL